MLAKASKFFQPSQQETKPSYYSKLPGWDQLTDEQKIAIIDMRISDDF